MVRECLEGFAGRELRVFFEGTVGAGGHAQALLRAHPEIERYIGCDQDPEALEIAQRVLEPWKGKVELIHGNFCDLDRYLEERDIAEADGFFLTWESPPCSWIGGRRGLVF
jgi:16S rRNA (cytosine1402-N4)-methyltransferase